MLQRALHESRNALRSHDTRTALRALRMRCALLCAFMMVCARAQAEPPCETLGARCPMPVNAESARGLALGSGVRATAMSTSALAYNPAGLVLGKLYHIETGVDYLVDFKSVALGGAVVDSATSRLGAGFALRGFVAGSGGLQGIDGRLALAFPFSDEVSIGLTGRYANISNEAPSVAEMARATRVLKGFTMDASLRIAPIPELQIDLAGYNFINRDSAYAPVLVGGGAGAVLGEIAVLGADLLVDVTSYKTAGVTVGGGVEVFAGRTVPLRGGYAFDTKRKLHTLSFGIGYTDRSVGVDLSLRQILGHDPDTRLMAAFRYYVH